MLTLLLAYALFTYNE